MQLILVLAGCLIGIYLLLTIITIVLTAAVKDVLTCFIIVVETFVSLWLTFYLTHNVAAPIIIKIYGKAVPSQTLANYGNIVEIVLLLIICVVQGFLLYLSIVRRNKVKKGNFNI